MSASRFVDQLYQKILGRPADKAGLEYWTGLVDSGLINAAELTRLLLDSAEFAGIVEPLARLYYTSFARTPDAGGLNYWLQAAQQGTALADIADAFVQSPEFLSLYGKLSNGAFLDLLYQNALGRNADAGGKAFWVEQLEHGAQRADILLSFANSPELSSAKQDAIKLIAAYHAVLGSMPEAAQLADAQSPGLADLAALYASPAYHGLALPHLNDANVVRQLEAAQQFSVLSQSAALLRGAGLGDAAHTASAAAAALSSLLAAHGQLQSPAALQGLLHQAAQSLGASASQLALVDRLASDAAHTMVQITGALAVSANLADSSAEALTNIALIRAANGAVADAMARGASYGDVSATSLLVSTSQLLSGGNSSSSASNTALPDFAAPLLLSANPANGGTLQGDQNLVLQFNETVQAGSGFIAITDGATVSVVMPNGSVSTHVVGATDYRAISITDSSQVTISGSTLTINPTGDLKVGVVYHLVLATGVLRDGAGNAFTGLNDASRLGFTATLIPDITAPTLLSSSPLDGASNVSATSPIVLNFSEAIQRGSGNIDLVNHANSSVIHVSVSDTEHVSINGNVLTLIPPSAFSSLSAISVLIDAGAVRDTSGNAFAGISDASVLNFGTSLVDTTAPSLLSSSPADNAIGVLPGADIVLTFSETVQAGTGSFVINDGSGDVRFISATDSQLSYSGNTVTLNPSADLLANHHYFLAVGANAVRDTANNFFAGFSSSTALDFYSQDTIAPTVTLSASPGVLKSGDTATVSIVFSENITGFSADNISALVSSSGHFSNLSGSDRVWFATFTPNVDVESSNVLIGFDFTGLTVRDSANNSASGTVTASPIVVDTHLPVATLTLSDTSLTIGETAQLSIHFDEAVPVLGSGALGANFGTLSTPLTTDGGHNWTATFTPNADTSASGNVITLVRNQAPDAHSNVAEGLTLSATYIVDTQRPTVASIDILDKALKLGETSTTITIVFSERVTNFDETDVTAGNALVSGLTSSDGITWTGTLTPLSNVQSASNTVAVLLGSLNDIAGNAGSASSHSPNYAIDNVRPTAVVTLSDSVLVNNELQIVTITFSEAVTGLSAADISMSSGTFQSLTTSDSIVWRATFAPNSGVESSAAIAQVSTSHVLDAAGNSGNQELSSSSFVIDTRAPTLVATFSDSLITVGETAIVSFTFSGGPVTGFDLSDISGLTHGSLSAPVSTDGGTLWTSTYTPSSAQQGSDSLSVALTGVQDLHGNSGSGSYSASSIVVDTSAPTLGIVVAGSSITFTFSEAVSGFTSSMITLPAGSLGNGGVLSTSDNITWTAVYNQPASTYLPNVTVQVAMSGIVDAHGNAGSGSATSNSFTIASTVPTMTMTMSDTALKVGETALLTFSFNGVVTSFGLDDITAENGSVSAPVSSDGGSTWTATFTPTNNVETSANHITVNLANVFENGVPGVSSVTSSAYSIDTHRPTATISLADDVLTLGETSLVTVVFSEVVSGFTSADITAPSGSLGSFSSSNGLTWTGTFTPSSSTDDATNVLSLAMTGVADANGNAGSGTVSSSNYTVDTIGISASIQIADNNLGVGETSLVSFDFSRSVFGFLVTGTTVDNGVLSNLTGSGAHWTATLTPTNGVYSASNHITLNYFTLLDIYNKNGVDSLVSNNYIVDTIRPTVTITMADSALLAGETSLVTISFSEKVSGFTNADLTVVNGTLSSVSSSDDITFTATYTPTSGVQDSSNVITLDKSGVLDMSGNAGSGSTSSSNFSIDTLRPAVSSMVLSTSTVNLTGATLTVVFNRAVSGLDTSDFSAVGEGTLGTPASSDGITWTASYTPTSAVTDTSNLITLNTAGVTDSAGNHGNTSSSTSNFSIDTVRPTVSTLTVASSLNASGGYVTLTFSEALASLASTAFNSNYGSFGTPLSSNGGLVWTSYFTPTANLSGIFDLTIVRSDGVDLAGNSGFGTELFTGVLNIDSTPPTVSMNNVTSDNIILLGEVGSYLTGSVSGASSVSLNLNGITRSASFDGSTAWYYQLSSSDISAIGQGSGLSFVVTASDSAGNTATASRTVTVDTTAPTVSFASFGHNGYLNDDAKGSFSFSGSVSSGSTVSLSVDGTAYPASVSGNTWSVSVAQSVYDSFAAGAIALSLSATNSSGNVTTVTDSLNVDRSAPTLSFNSYASYVGDTSISNFTLSGAVSSDVASVTLQIGNNARSATISGSSWSYTLCADDFSALGHGQASIGFTVYDLAGNRNTTPTATFLVAPPDISLLEFSNDSGSDSDDYITNSAAQTVYANLSRSLSSGDSVQFSLDNGATWQGPAQGSGTSWAIFPTLSGSNTVIARVTDSSGNVGATISHAYQIDLTAPSVSSTNLLTSSEALSGNVVVHFSEAVHFSGTGYLRFIPSIDVASTDIAISSSNLSSDGLTLTVDRGSLHDSRSYSLAFTSNLLFDVAGNALPASTGVGFVTLDQTAPTLNYVTATTGYYHAGDVISITLSYSEAVSFSSTPSLTLNTGGSASYASGNNSSSLVFTYTVGSGENISTLDLSAGPSGLTDASGNSASTSVPSGFGSLPYHALTIDTVRPTILSITATAGYYKYGDIIPLTLTFSEAVSGGANTYFYLNASGAATASYNSSPTSFTMIFNYQVGSGHTSSGLEMTANLAGMNGIYDLAGNIVNATAPSGTGALLNSLVVIDTTAPAAPTLTGLSTATDSGYSSTDLLTNVALPSFVGVAEAYSTVKIYDGSTLVGSATAAADGSYTVAATSSFTEGVHSNITAVVTDRAGNVGTASSALTVTFDFTGIDPNSVSYTGLQSLLAGAHLTFAENIYLATSTEFGLTQFTNALSGVTGTVSGTELYVNSSSLAILSATVTVGANTILDAAGNPMTGSISHVVSLIGA